MNNDTIVSHRCSVSLNRGMSIRKSTCKNNINKFLEKDNWYLYQTETDYDYNSTYLVVVCQIEICPFCGEVLK